MAQKMAITVEHKETQEKLYFIDGNSYDKFMEQNNEDDYEYFGFQMLPEGVDIIDMDTEFTEYRRLCAAVGIDHKHVEFDSEKEKQDLEQWIKDLQEAGIVRKVEPAPVNEQGARLYKPMTKKEFTDRVLEDVKEFGRYDSTSPHPKMPEIWAAYTKIQPKVNDLLVYDLIHERCNPQDFGVRVNWQNVIKENTIVYNKKLGMSYIKTGIGGNWEFPVNAIIYIGSDDNYYIYIPKQGNTFNTLNNAAFGNDTEGKDLEELQKLGFNVKTKEDVCSLIQGLKIDKTMDKTLMQQDIESNFAV